MYSVYTSHAHTNLVRHGNTCRETWYWIVIWVSLVLLALVLDESILELDADVWPFWYVVIGSMKFELWIKEMRQTCIMHHYLCFMQGDIRDILRLRKSLLKAILGHFNWQVCFCCFAKVIDNIKEWSIYQLKIKCKHYESCNYLFFVSVTGTIFLQRVLFHFPHFYICSACFISFSTFLLTR